MIKAKLSLYFKGTLMGIAEIIPGVSGGTVAFISGIYEELISSIKSFQSSAQNVDVLIHEFFLQLLLVYR